MRNKCLKHIVAVVLLLPTTLVFGSNRQVVKADSIQTNAILSFVPQYAMVGGLRLDFDFRVNGKHWIQAAPILFLRDSANFFNEASQLRGTGIHLYHKYYPGRGYGFVPVYLSWGLVYHYAHLHFDEKLPAGQFSRYTNIHKAGIDIIMGFYTILGENFMLDLYAGMGLRHSFAKSDAEVVPRYDDFYFDYGYSGNVLLVGFRFGIPFKL